MKGYGELLRESWEVFKKYPFTYLKIGVTGLLIDVLAAVLFVVIGGILFALKVPVLLIGIVVGFPAVFVFIYLQSWIGLSTTTAFLLNSEGQDSSIQQIFRDARKDTLSFLGMNLASGFIVLGGMLLFAIPGLIFAIWFSMASYIFIHDQKRSLMALLTSREYLRGYTFKVLLYTASLSIIAGILTSTLNSAFSNSDIRLIGRLVSVFINYIFGAIGLLFSISIYKELRRIKPQVEVLNYEKRKWKYIAVSVLGFVLPIVLGLYIATNVFSNKPTTNTVIDTSRITTPGTVKVY